MVHDEVVAVPRPVLVEALDMMGMPPDLTLCRQPSALGSSLVLFSAQHHCLGSLGHMRFQDLGNSCTRVSCQTPIPSVEEALIFEARVQACMQLVDKASLRAAVESGQDEGEAAINLYLPAQELYEMNVGRVDRYLADLATLPVAERALLVFANVSVNDLPAMARQFIGLVGPLYMDGMMVRLFERWPTRCDETRIITLISEKTEKAQMSLEARKIDRLRRLLDAVKKSLRRDGVLIADYTTSQQALHEDHTILPIRMNTPHIKDPVNKRILDLVTDDPDLTDTQIGQQLHLSRQAVNKRRKGLENLGYKVR